MPIIRSDSDYSLLFLCSYLLSPVINSCFSKAEEQQQLIVEHAAAGILQRVTWLQKSKIFPDIFGTQKWAVACSLKCLQIKWHLCQDQITTFKQNISYFRLINMPRSRSRSASRSRSGGRTRYRTRSRWEIKLFERIFFDLIWICQVPQPSPQKRILQVADV